MNKFNNISVALWASVLALVFSFSLYQSQITGDGHEYLMYARAFAAHLSPDFRRDDVMHVASMLDKSNPEFRTSLNKLGKEKTIGDLQYGRGFVTSPRGELHSWHFWSYPLFVAPFFELTHWVDLPPATAFTLCNWAFIFGALSYLLFFWKGSALQKQTLAALFLLTGTTYYVWWSHPEIFTASLMLLALMMASDKRYGLAMISSAVAATQNPPVILLIGFIASLAVFDIVRQNNDYHIGRKWALIGGKVVPFFIVSLAIATLPVVYFLYTLGVANPIVAGGAANPALISLGRLESFFFDLNMGMVVAGPGIFVGIAFVLLASLVGSRFNIWNGIIARHWFLVFCILLSVAMALPTLSTTNWNHGHSVYGRYAYWVGIPLIYGLVISMHSLGERARLTTSFVIICIQLFAVAYYGVFGKNWRSDYAAFKPISNYVLRNYPWLYNPIPEIFIERLNNKEGVSKPGDANQLIFAYPSINKPTKLLLSKDMAASVATKCSPTSVVYTEGGWAYINLPSASKCNSIITR